MTSYQKTFRVDRVWSTGQKSYQILSRLHCQITGILRFHDMDLIHFVAECLIQYTDQKMISVFQLIQVCEKTGTWKTTVCRDYRMGILSTYRKGTSFQMTGSFTKHFF